MVGGLAMGALLISSVRMEGVTGNWIPTGWRWSWEKPRDFARAKPAAGSTTISAQKDAEPDNAMRPLRPVATTPDDFPQFLGPDRNGYLPDAKLSHDWHANPPQVVWRKEVGAGWSSFAVVGDHAI